MKEKRLTVVFFQDPGHGWLSVRIERLAELGIVDKISSYSYYDARTGFALLEEDDDADKFVKAAKAAGYELDVIEEVEPTGDSWVRSLPSYPYGRKELSYHLAEFKEVRDRFKQLLGGLKWQSEHLTERAWSIHAAIGRLTVAGAVDYWQRKGA